MLEVVYEAERGARQSNIVAPNASGMMQGVGFSGGNAGQQDRGAPLAAASSGGGGGLLLIVRFNTSKSGDVGSRCQPARMHSHAFRPSIPRGYSQGH
jgi:hypothetical protein